MAGDLEQLVALISRIALPAVIERPHQVRLNFGILRQPFCNSFDRKVVRRVKNLQGQSHDEFFCLVTQRDKLRACVQDATPQARQRVPVSERTNNSIDHVPRRPQQALDHGGSRNRHRVIEAFIVDPFEKPEVRFNGPAQHDQGHLVQPIPSRITTSEVLQLARYGVKKLWRNRRAGTMPNPIDRGKEALFDRDAVLKALGMIHDDAPQPATDEWEVDSDAFRAVGARKVRQSAAAKGRDVSRPVRGAAAPPALRLIAVVSSADRGPAHR